MPDPTSTDQNFERTFADLAYARLQDKAPSMLQYLIGFQLIDKNEEGTHAVGLFGFKVGSEWVYAPVFFINGELKGHELMYIKGQDSFVPMVEEWVNYILNRRPPILGHGEETPRNELPIRGPDFDVFASSPRAGQKMAGDHSFSAACRRVKDWALGFMHNFTISPRDEKYASLQHRLSLPGAMCLLGEKAAYRLVNSMRNDTKFANAVLSFYDIKDLVEYEKVAKLVKKPARKMTKSCSVAGNPLAPVQKRATSEGLEELDEQGQKMRKGPATTPKAIVITRGEELAYESLTDEEKKKLFRDQYVVRDGRQESEKSVLYRSQIGQSLFTPTESGMYEIATGYGDKRKLLVLLAPRQVGYSGGHSIIVIDPAKKQLGSFDSNKIVVSKKLDIGDWKKVFDALPSAEGLSIGDMAVILGPNGESTQIFEVEEKTEGLDGSTELTIDKAYMDGRGGGGFQVPGSNRCCGPAMACSSSSDRIDRVCFTGKAGERMTSLGQTLYVPKGFKAFKVYIGKGGPGAGSDSWESRDKRRNEARIDLGSMADVVLKLFKSAADGRKVAHTLQLRTDGLSFFPHVDGRVCSRPLTKLAALKYLISTLGLAQEDAEMVVKEAKPRQSETFIFKAAYGSQPVTGEFPEPIVSDQVGVGAPVQYDSSSVQNLGQNDNAAAKAMYDPDPQLDPTTKQQAVSAAEQGQKEILDTAVISGLVKTMDPDTSIDGYISDMLLGNDRVGRTLFMYYWHNEKFKDRYGQQDMVELEDNLRNVFKNLGELTLFLKQKTIDPGQSDSSEVELTDVIQ